MSFRRGVVARSLPANPNTGVISGNIYGQDQIFCGNINSTEWLVTHLHRRCECESSALAKCAFVICGDLVIVPLSAVTGSQAP
jgi:hypothetical protein